MFKRVGNEIYAIVPVDGMKYSFYLKVWNVRSCTWEAICRGPKSFCEECLQAFGG